MKKLFPIFLLFAAGSTFTAQGQHQHTSREGQAWCGSQVDAQQEAFLSEFATFYYERGGQQQYQTQGRAMKYVPVSYHLVADSDGSNRYSLSAALNDLCITNQDMQHADIQLYLKPNPNRNNAIINMTINNTAWNEGTGNPPSQITLMPNLNNDRNAMNIYQVKSIRNNNQVLGFAGGSVFFNQGSPNVQSAAIYIKRGNGGADQTLAHEIGHHLSLAHTFYGWEGLADYSCGTKAGNDKELYSRANCSTAGDRMCDTEPDYIAGGFQCTGGSNSHTACTQMDADSATGFADGRNIMSYGFGCSNRAFSQDQINAMDFHLTTYRANLIASSPTVNAITANAVLLPADADLYDEVILNWTAVPNATYYAVEVSRTPSFSASSGLFAAMRVTNTNTVTITNLDPNTNYFWRIVPFNASYFCASPSGLGSFRTGEFSTPTTEIAGLNTISLQPNKTSPGRSARLFIAATDNIEATVRIFNAQGQAVHGAEAIAIQHGENTFDLNTSALASGLYFVNVTTASGTVTKKLLVTP